MIRFLLLVLLAAAVGAGAAWYLHADNGYVLIGIGPWVLETSALGFAGFVAAVALALYVLVRLLIAGLRLPSRIREALQERRGAKARESFERGLLHYLEGRWARAEVELVRRASDHPVPHLNYLLAARAAQRTGACERRDHYLMLAQHNSPQAEEPALLTQAELLCERGEFEQARAAALKLHDQDPKHVYAIALLAGLYEQSGEWEPLRALLLRTEKLRALPPERHRTLMIRCLRELIVAAGAQGRLDSVKQAWAAVSAAFRNESEVRNPYLAALARMGADAEAGALIAAAVKREWDPELARIYGELEGLDGMGQLATVEQWLTQHGERPELLLVAGRVCARNRLWGKARSYLEGAIRQQPTPQAYLLLARLCQETQNPEEAGKFYRQGLELAAQPAPGQVS